MNAAPAADRLKEALRGATCHGPVPEPEVALAEKQLGVRFPPSLRLFLSAYGAAFGRGPELLGLPISDTPHQPPLWSNLVAQNIRARGHRYAPLSPRFLEVSSDGQDSRYLIDLGRLSEDGESPVVALGPGREFEQVAHSFVEFVENSWRAGT